MEETIENKPNEQTTNNYILYAEPGKYSSKR